MTTWQDRGSIGLRSARSSTRFAATPKGIAFHWEGVKVDQGTLEQSQQNLRTIQRAHMNNAKESYVDIAYNFAIDHLGNILSFAAGTSNQVQMVLRKQIKNILRCVISVALETVLQMQQKRHSKHSEKRPAHEALEIVTSLTAISRQLHALVTKYAHLLLIYLAAYQRPRLRSPRRYSRQSRRRSRPSRV